MTAYMDTSAMIRAYRANIQPKGKTRSHTLSEFYCTLTGPGVLSIISGREIKEKLSPMETAKEARATFSKITFIDLTADEVFKTLELAARENVQGRNIHDLMHCAAAEKAKCDAIVTLNFSDFSVMTDLPLIHPSKHLSRERAA